MTTKFTVLAALFIIFFTLSGLEAQTPMRPPPQPKSPQELFVGTTQNQPPEPRPPAVQARGQKQSLPKENCEPYYEKAARAADISAGIQLSSNTTATERLAFAQQSLAYSQLYQNCVTRNKH